MLFSGFGLQGDDPLRLRRGVEAGGQLKGLEEDRVMVWQLLWGLEWEALLIPEVTSVEHARPRIGTCKPQGFRARKHENRVTGQEDLRDPGAQHLRSITVWK